MNDKLQAALAEILKTLQSGAEAVAHGAQTELPQLVREYLAWGVWSNGATVALSLLVYLFALRGCRAIATSKSQECINGDCRGGECGHMKWSVLSGKFVCPIISTLMFVLAVFDAVLQIVQVAVAPRVYLLEQVSRLAGLK